MKLIYLLSLPLLPIAFSLPQSQPESAKHPINPPPHIQNFIKRAFGAGETGFEGTSVAGEKDTSTLTSLIMFKPSASPSSEPTTTVTGTSPSSSASEEDQIVSPFYPSTSDEDDSQDDTESLQSLSQGQSAAFNPTPSTTLSLLTNSLNTATGTATVGSNRLTTGSASGVMVAAASDTGISTSSGSTSGAMGRMEVVGMKRVLGLGVLGVVVSYLI